jgi:hypothetical protein
LSLPIFLNFIGTILRRGLFLSPKLLKGHEAKLLNGHENKEESWLREPGWERAARSIIEAGR